MTWLWLSAATMAVTALLHSWLGERRLIGPLVNSNHGVMQHERARKVTRFAWHFTSLLMLLSAALVAWPDTPLPLVATAGVLWLAVGLFDGIYTRGQHVGWPFLAGAGALALIGSLG